MFVAYFTASSINSSGNIPQPILHPVIECDFESPFNIIRLLKDSEFSIMLVSLELKIIFEYISSLNTYIVFLKVFRKLKSFFCSDCIITLPVGLHGVFKIINFVLLLIFSIISLATKLKSFCSFKSKYTVFEPQ